MNFDNQKQLETLEGLREKVTWEKENERHEFIHQLNSLIRNWKGQLPNLRDIFRKGEIDQLLLDSMSFCGVEHDRQGKRFVDIVARSGYKDEPDLDDDGKPLLRRTTPLHKALEGSNNFFVRRLFEIYDRFDVNYVNEEGLTHFHVACKYGLDDIVQKFLELGQDPNCSGESPLHLALFAERDDTATLLLRSGADPNATNEDGLTPLHVVCQRADDEGGMVRMVKMIFEISDEKHRTVKIDAQDKSGHSPLQFAVANRLPAVIDVLLDSGADLSSFVFPSKSFCVESMGSISNEDERIHLKKKLYQACYISSVIEHLEKRGYELARSDALNIMSLFAAYELFGKSADLDESWYDNEEFVSKTKEMVIETNLPLYNLILLKLDKMATILKCDLTKKSRVHCLLEMLPKRFFRRWALGFFLDLTRYQLPILCCEKIIKLLMNEDIWHICLTVTGQSSPDGT